MAVEFGEVMRLFEQALRRPRGERASWLQHACPASAETRREIEAMLAAHERAEGILDRSLSSLVSGAESKSAEFLDPGEQVGPYRVERRVGQGGMGVVYQARDPRLNRPVALKFLPPRAHSDERARARFLAEARAASALDHPNICTIYDVGEGLDGRIYVAMAFYEGETLDRKIEHGPLGVEEALSIAAQVAEGLAAAHDAGIVHRDIKPSNLMITRRAEVKILDFGIAKLENDGSLTEPGTVLGTPAYMSPELVGGDTVDGRSDLWSLGVVLYEMLTGKRPFGGDKLAALRSVLHDDPPDLQAMRPGVSERVAAVVRRLMAKSPADRYADASELLLDLQALRAGRVPGVARVGTRLAIPDVLPSSRTTFVGREKEIERVTQLLLEGSRLVTLTGPAGTGKTRLAMRAAHEMVTEFHDGVHFVALASLSDHALVIDAVARALGVEESSDSSALELASAAIADGRVLLVLDNFEQVAEGAPAVSELLDNCANLSVLATSRIPLHLSGEYEFPVPPLDLPELGPEPGTAELETCSSVVLFCERARAARPDFALHRDNAGAVAELCVRLDGLPLAIELAAARIKHLSPQAVLKRLGHQLDLLKGGPRDLPARHQTLRGAIAWSYELLDEAERHLFRHLSAFVGGCTLEAAEAICGTGPGAAGMDLIDDVAALVDHSLLRREEGEGGEPRFTMLGTIRAFGQERLRERGEAEETYRVHALYFMDLVERAAPELTGAEQGAWLDRLAAEHDNLRSAMGWVVARSETELGLRFGAALWRFWLVRGHMGEGRVWLEKLLALPEQAGSAAVRARALNGIGTLAHNHGDNRVARHYLEDSLALCRELNDRSCMAAVLNNLAWVACELCDFEQARSLSQEALKLCRELGDTRGVAVALNNLGWVANYQGDHRDACSFHEGSLELRRKIGDRRGAAFALINIAWAEHYRGKHQRAARLLDEARAAARASGDRIMRVWLLCVEGQVELAQGRHERAAAALEECLSLWREDSNTSLRALGSTYLADVLSERGEIDRAEGLYRQARATFEQIESPWGMAQALFGLGGLAKRKDDLQEAAALYRESLEIRQQLEDKRGIVESLEAMAALLHGQAEVETAARLLGAASAFREALGTPRPERRRQEHEARLESLRSAIGDARFVGIHSEGRQLTLSQATAMALASR